MASTFGSAPGIIVGVGVGAAASAALEPAIEVPRQKAWQQNPQKLLNVGVLARLIAQGGIPLDATAYDDANREGYGDDKLDALVYLEQTVPAISEALILWRRGLMSDVLWDHVLVKAGLDARYASVLTANKLAEPLAPAQIALGVVRSLLADPGLMPVSLDTSGGIVPAYPQSNIDAVAEAAQSGIERERLRVLVGEIGLPMSTQQAASAFFRGIIKHGDYYRSILEGDVRPEWADAILAQARQILTAHDYAELELRGYLTQTQRRAATDQHGMSTADSDLLYDVLGRSIPVHQITTGLARGGVFNGPTGNIPPEYLQSLQRGNLRPEYYNLAYANRYSYPSAFVLRGLAEAGQLGNAAAVQQILLEIGWPPHLAASVSAQWVPAGAAMDKHVAKAQTQLWTTTHRSYVASEIDDPTADGALTAAGVTPAAIPQVLALWAHERSLIRAQLSPKEIVKAVNEAVPNPATGAPWNLADGMAALLARGYSQNDAATLLAE